MAPPNAMLSVVASAATIPMSRRSGLMKKNADLTKICNAGDYQLVAKSIISKPLYEYLASGTDDEQTLSENVSTKE